MSDVYRIYGAEVSPYSVKVRSYFRYKEIPHEWIVRDQSRMAEFQSYAKLPLITLVVTPADEPLQDSTPILERLETEFPTQGETPEIWIAVLENDAACLSAISTSQNALMRTPCVVLNE